jgi:hypothetical protein
VPNLRGTSSLAGRHTSGEVSLLRDPQPRSSCCH